MTTFVVVVSSTVDDLWGMYTIPLKVGANMKASVIVEIVMQINVITKQVFGFSAFEIISVFVCPSILTFQHTTKNVHSIGDNNEREFDEHSDTSQDRDR